MGVLDTIRETQTPKKMPIVKTQKTLAKGFLFGHVSNGGGIINLDDGYALKIVALDDKFVKVYLLDYGKDIPIIPQLWKKTKEVGKKDDDKTFVVEEAEEAEDLF